VATGLTARKARLAEYAPGIHERAGLGLPYRRGEAQRGRVGRDSAYTLLHSKNQVHRPTSTSPTKLTPSLWKCAT
jgi:hypothetical protein